MSKLKDEIGNKYGFLTVIKRAENDSNGRARWECQCDCGNKIVVLGKSLRNGNTKSCGCFQKQRVIELNISRTDDLIGKKFGKLTVVQEQGFITHSNGKRSRIYQCKCDCGNVCIVQHQYLNSGDTTSCGCIRSRGEYQIEQLLKQYNIPFIREYIFQDLKDKSALRFDFAILSEDKVAAVLEFQGEQHFCKTNGFYSEDLIRHDKMKEEYCTKNNIPFIKIFYKKKQNLTIKDLQLEKIGGLEIGI